MVVPPGKYNLSLFQPTNYSFDVSCFQFDLKISISPKESTNDRVDCSEAALFPWNFKDFQGGSAPFGGPMLSGHLNVWHNKILLTGTYN